MELFLHGKITSTKFMHFRFSLLPQPFNPYSPARARKNRSRLIVLVAPIHVLTYVEPLDRWGVHWNVPVIGRAPIVVDLQRLGLPRPVHAPSVRGVNRVPQVYTLPRQNPERVPLHPYLHGQVVM